MQPHVAERCDHAEADEARRAAQQAAQALRSHDLERLDLHRADPLLVRAGDAPVEPPEPGAPQQGGHQQQQGRDRELLGGAQHHAGSAGGAIVQHRLLDAVGQPGSEGFERQVLEAGVPVDDDHQHAIAGSQAEPSFG